MSSVVCLVRRVRRVVIVAVACLASPTLARAADPPATATAPATLIAPSPALAKIADAAGTPVTIGASNNDTWIFLAKGDVPENTLPDPFERVGVAPLEIRLAPGVYTLESGSPTSSTGRARFRVEQGHPFHIDVSNGDAMVKTFGAISIGTGIIAVLLGIVTIVSVSSNDSHFNRYALGLPLLIGGGAASALGVGLSFAGATSVKMPASNQAISGQLTIRF